MNAFPKQGRVGVEREGESGSRERRGEWEWREERRVGVERGGEEEGNRRREGGGREN